MTGLRGVPHPTGTDATSLGVAADARGPQGGLERAACPRSGARLLSPIVVVQEAAHDDNTAAFLLAQSLRQRQEEEEDAAKRRVVRKKDAEERKGAVDGEHASKMAHVETGRAP